MNQKHTSMCSHSVLQPLLCTLRGVLVMMFLLAGASRAHAEDIPQKTFAHPDRIRYDGSCMTIDGHDTFIYSAAFHYFRCPEALWRDRFAKIKEACVWQPTAPVSSSSTTPMTSSLPAAG